MRTKKSKHFNIICRRSTIDSQENRFGILNDTSNGKVKNDNLINKVVQREKLSKKQYIVSK